MADEETGSASTATGKCQEKQEIEGLHNEKGTLPSITSLVYTMMKV